MLKALLAATALLTMMTPVQAQDRVTLGWGRLFSNDALGDGQDRWRTGAYALSLVRGTNWSGSLPQTAGEILEFRLRADTIAPANLTNPAADDRRYAGVLSLSVHTQLALAGFEADLGGGLDLVGPQTGIGRFQSWAHGLMGQGDINALDDQIDNAAFLALSAEVGRRIALGNQAELRPFIAAETGIETLVRAGGDLVIGDFGRDDLMLRDNATGQRYRGVQGTRIEGVSLTLGGDIARVLDSHLLPDDGAAQMEDTRSRLRAGVQWQGANASAFYGVTYLSPEFAGQEDGQVLGSLALNLRF